MADIYRQARRVLIWLGDASPDDDIQVVFSFLKRLTSIKHIAITNEVVQNLIEEVFKCLDINKLQALLQRSWFQRRWIIQEVALGHDSIVHCGPFHISWHWFVDALRRLQKASDRGAIALGSAALDTVSNACAIYSHANEMLTLLWDFHKSECHDPRDRIFSLYRLAEDVEPKITHSKHPVLKTSSERTPFAVDYTSSLVDVYHRLAHDCVASGNWELLMKHLFAFGPLWEQQNDPTIPSWIPAWNQGRRFTHFTVIVGGTSPFFRMGMGDLKVEFEGQGLQRVRFLSNE